MATETPGSQRKLPAARRHEGFPQCVFTVRVVAGRQEAIYVADDSDGAALGGVSNGGWCHVYPPHFIMVE
jgi:hypothetical protein